MQTSPIRQLENFSVLLWDNGDTFTPLLKLLLKNMGVQQLYLAKSQEQVVSSFTRNKPSICILNIEGSKNQQNGISVASCIRKKNKQVPIVFICSNFEDDLYTKVSALQPVSFMNKEISRLKLLQTIQLSMLQMENIELNEKLSAPTNAFLIKKPLNQKNNSQVFFKIGDSFKGIDLEKIDFFYAENKLTYARVDNRNYPTNVQLKKLEDELHPTFLRCHKKYLVNVDQIESIMVRDGKIKIGKELLSIGYAYRKTFLDGLHLLK